MAVILVVDDEDMIRQTVRSTLELDGHTILDTSDGARVLQMLQENQVDLVLTDILMPGWNGLHTISEIRRLGHSVKIIAMSGSGVSFIHLEDAVKLGADAILEKPFRPRELRAMVVSLIKEAA
jgi:DNA-binding response OmpR family regulator